MRFREGSRVGEGGGVAGGEGAVGLWVGGGVE